LGGLINEHNGKSINVKVIKLDDFFTNLKYKVINVLKIDVEGAEWHMFDDKEVWMSIRNIAIEYHLWQAKDQDHNTIRDIITRLGFCIKKQNILHPEFGIILASRK